jgi:hypothetical protein
LAGPYVFEQGVEAKAIRPLNLLAGEIQRCAPVITGAL